jgi:hypothetical protein
MRHNLDMSGRRLIVTAALVVVVAFAALGGGRLSVRPLGQRVDPEENEATRVTASGRCGVERWAVKTLSDPGADTVALVPKRATVIGMNALPAPTLPDDNTTRLSTERQAFRVSATLVKYKLESDQDIHLVLAQDGKTMIAEMPSVHCDYGARARYAMLVARDRLEREYGPAGDHWTYVGQPGTFTGVRFFDFMHGQSGVADNAVELHPVFGFKP